MILYRIRNWADIYENNRTRELKNLSWVPIPNKQDGDGYTAIMELKNGPAIFGAWIACVQIASRCDPRGTLMRDCGNPHTPHSLARMSRMPTGLLEDMLTSLSLGDINWLEQEIYNNPAESCDATALSCDTVAPRARARPEQKEGNEQKGTEGKGASAPSVASLPFPSEEFKTVWDDWKSDRKARKKPITPKAQELQLIKLSAWGESKAILALKNSISNGWQGLFEPNENRHGNSGGSRPTAADIRNSRISGAEEIRERTEREWAEQLADPEGHTASFCGPPPQPKGVGVVPPPTAQP